MNRLRHILIRKTHHYPLFDYISWKSSSKSYCLKQSVIVAQQYCSGHDFAINFDTPAIQKYINNLIAEYNTLQVREDLFDGNKKNRLSELQPVVSLMQEREALQENLKSLKELLSGDMNDKIFRSSVVEEQQIYQQRIKELEKMLLSVLVPAEEEDSCSDVMMEVSAGVGGQEAMLFAKELFGMYCNYAVYKHWNMEIAQHDQSEMGGLRHGSLLVSGREVYQCLKYEVGVHRVQRVPATEKSGRVHTSTVTVAVLAQPDEVNIVLHNKDLRIETKRASGAGGQHVNTTESAVRITHIPTGISVECQVDRSQIKNRSIAMRTLQARIYNRQMEEQVSKTHALRKQQVGSSMRSEKIRTYNFNQDRITDHRLGHNFYNMPNFLLGAEDLDSLIRQLHAKRNRERLKDFIASLESKL